MSDPFATIEAARKAEPATEASRKLLALDYWAGNEATLLILRSWLAKVEAEARATADGDLELGAAWGAAAAALPAGFTLMVGQTDQCQFCSGWWATASKRVPKDEGWVRIVTSESGRPRGEHHDATPAAALRELTARLPR